MAEPAEHAEKKVRVENDANGEPVAKPARAPLLTLGENGATTGSAIDLLRDYVGGRTVVERAAPEQAPRLDWGRYFPLLGVSPMSDGSGLSFLPQAEASPLAQLLLQLDFLRRTDRNSINFTSDHVVTAVGEVLRVISECGYDWSPQMQQKLGTTLNSSANVEYALRYATMALNLLVREVLLYLAPDAAPLDQLATVESTKRGAFCDSYDQIGLLHELALIFSRFPTKMQKPGGLGAVHRALRGGRASPPPPTSAASLSSAGTTPSATIVAADSSSVTVATSLSAPDATIKPVCPPLPPAPPTSSSLSGTLPSTESVAPSSSLTNNVKLTSDTAASSKAPLPSDCALAELRTRLASRENKDSSLDATTMDVDQKSSAPDAQALADLLKVYSFAVPEGSNVLVKGDLSVGNVLYTHNLGGHGHKLVKVIKVPKKGAYIISKDSTGADLSIRPGQLRMPSQADTDRFPSPDEAWTEAPLLATPPPPISLPPADIIIRAVDGTCRILSQREIRLNGKSFGDAEKHQLQSPVETESDALDVLELAAVTLDRVLSTVQEDRVRIVDRDSLRKVNAECQPLVLLKSLRGLLQEWTKVPEHEKPPLTSTPVATPRNESIVDGSRDRKTTQLFANDPEAQKSSYSARYAARTATELSCAECGEAFTFSGGERRYTCTEEVCKKIFCSKCAGYATNQKTDSKWKCPACKLAAPIDVVKSGQNGGSLVHGNEARLLDAERIKWALGDRYVEYCKDMGTAFGSEVWYDLEVLTGAYEGDAACRRFTKSTRGTSNICIDRRNRGVFAVYDDFWDYCREPGETPLEVAERMTVEVHPGFVVIAKLFEWGVLHYLDGKDGGFVGGWRMERLRDDHHVDQRSMPTVADFLALPYQECLKRLDDPEWPTPELKDMFCEFGAEEKKRLAISGSSVPPARQPAQGPGSRNHAPETPAAIVADREERGVRERATLEFLLAFKAGRLRDPAMQVIDGLHRISGWLSIACVDGSLSVSQHIKQQTNLYLAAVKIRELMGESETRGPFVRSPLGHFLDTGVGDGSDIEKLRGHWNVFMGASWRVRYRETPTSEYKYVELRSLWEKFDPAARNAGLEALPAPDARAPRSRK